MERNEVFLYKGVGFFRVQPCPFGLTSFLLVRKRGSGAPNRLTKEGSGKREPVHPETYDATIKKGTKLERTFTTISAHERF